jgi:hypothetical protein
MFTQEVPSLRICSVESTNQMQPSRHHHHPTIHHLDFSIFVMIAKYRQCAQITGDAVINLAQQDICDHNIRYHTLVVVSLDVMLTIVKPILLWLITSADNGPHGPLEVWTSITSNTGKHMTLVMYSSSQPAMK